MWFFRGQACNVKQAKWDPVRSAKKLLKNASRGFMDSWSEKKTLKKKNSFEFTGRVCLSCSKFTFSMCCGR